VFNSFSTKLHFVLPNFVLPNPEKEHVEMYKEHLLIHLFTHGIEDEKRKQGLFPSWIGSVCYQLLG
jgi:hypothetical protein